MSVLANVLVYCVETKKTLVQWRITSVSPPDVTFVNFLQDSILNQPCELKNVYVGRQKESLDEADMNMCVSQVVSMFGPFIKFHVKSESSSALSQPATARNAFDVLQEGQRRLEAKKLPSHIEPKNKKHKLRNDIIDMLDQNALLFKHGEVSSHGEQLVHSLTDTLWYIDGHHEVFKGQNLTIPNCFDTFCGYNKPEASKHWKREIGNMSFEVLKHSSRQLFSCLQASYWDRQGWSTFRDSVEQLARILDEYSEYLGQKNKQMRLLHSRLVPAREVGDNLHFMFLPVSSSSFSSFKSLEDKLKSSEFFQSLLINDFSPADSFKRYEYMQKLKKFGLPFASALLTYSHGNNVGNLSFIWRVHNNDSDNYSRCVHVIEQVKLQLPSYKTRAMRAAAFDKFGRITPGMSPTAFQYIYKELTGDYSACSNLDSSEIEKRVKLAVDMEDSDVIIDLRHLNSGRKSIYDTFWLECSKFIQECIGQAVDDRRHQQVTHFATAMSVPDLISQVAKKLPEGAAIPCESWVCLQFWPKNKHLRSSCHYTGKLDIKCMVQSRQLRKSHEDAHYAAALFRYERQMAVTFRNHSIFACLDDKHRVPVGEPSYPVAAVERGKRVIVARNQSFMVADHDFTRFSLVPSVDFFVDIPEEISASWYTGQVIVNLKEGSMEPSSPLRHATELLQCIKQEYASVPPVLFTYTDGGPDHRLTYLSVQLTLIILFLELDLDFLCAVRTAPAQSWKNPVEQVMSVLNLGLQSVGLMRKEREHDVEQVLKNCNSLKQIRAAVQQQPSLASDIRDSIEPVKLLLSELFVRLSLKGKFIKMSTPATGEEMEELNEQLRNIDFVDLSNSVKKSMLKNMPKLKEFMDHCCQIRHYSFCIKKCGQSDCHICKEPRLPPEVFCDLHMLPDPTPGDEGHYRPFDSVYGKTTSEVHRPSLSKSSKRRKTLPFIASIQHAKNTNVLVECVECGV